MRLQDKLFELTPEAQVLERKLGKRTMVGEGSGSKLNPRGTEVSPVKRNFIAKGSIP